MIRAYYYDHTNEKIYCKILSFVGISYNVKAVVQLDGTSNLLAIDIQYLTISEVEDER